MWIRRLNLILVIFFFNLCNLNNSNVEFKKEYITISDEVEIWVESVGNSIDEAVIFISGAGANSSFWSDCLCVQLVNKGFFVVKYDHRDFGYSTKIDFDNNPYDVMQLAKDVIVLMDSLKLEKAHVVGHSMGGFIVQLLAIHYPERINSITSISSSTNSAHVPPPPDKTWKIFMEYAPVNDYKKDVVGLMPVWEYLNGTAEFHEELAKEYMKNIYERQDVKGALGEGHVKAQANLYDRSEKLKNVKLPSLVIHGDEDYLVDKMGGIQTAECIENSTFVLIPEMGHMPFNYKILERFENEIFSFLNTQKNKI
jgi:pimeloyl-ACP methyl ester carboxylesterase